MFVHGRPVLFSLTFSSKAGAYLGGAQDCSELLPLNMLLDGATTLSITTFSITTLSITMICHYAKCNYQECRVLLIIIILSVVMLIVVKLSVVMLSVVMLSVVMLSVVAPPGLHPNIRLGCNSSKWTNTLAYWPGASVTNKIKTSNAVLLQPKLRGRHDGQHSDIQH